MKRCNQKWLHFFFSLVADDCGDAATTACILRNIKKFLTNPNKLP